VLITNLMGSFETMRTRRQGVAAGSFRMYNYGDAVIADHEPALRLTHLWHVDGGVNAVPML